jgi:serine/threonine protein kinase
MESTAQRNQRIPHRAIYEMSELISSALAAAWFKVPLGKAEPMRVVHRDIKPSNVMVSTEGELRVLDFGTARFEDASRIAKTEAFRFGSLKYMSPERREGARGDHAADMYSLGLVIIELLGGRITETLPVAPTAHDAAILRLIDAIPDFGLPNSGWDNSLLETLSRLCAHDAENRLDARQTVKLMRAFKQQANGDGLMAFAEDIVAPLTDSIHAIPSLKEPASDEGTCFALEADGKTSILRRSTDLEKQPAALDEMATQVNLKVETEAGATPKAPAAIQIRHTLPLEDEPTQPEPHRHQTDDALRPGFAVADDTRKAFDAHTQSPPRLGDPQSVAQQDDVPSSWNPRQKSRPPNPGPQPAPGRAARLPPPKPATEPDRIRLLAIGCGLAVTVLLIVGLIGAAAWILFGQEQPSTVKPSGLAPMIEASTKYDEAPDNLFQVSFQAGDPTVQWIRLRNKNGDLLLTAKPDGSTSVAAGTYEIAVKVVARSVLTKKIDLNSDTSLTCKPSTMGRVRCTDPTGASKIILRP